jgi:hypothetical protein
MTLRFASRSLKGTACLPELDPNAKLEKTNHATLQSQQPNG